MAGRWQFVRRKDLLALWGTERAVRAQLQTDSYVRVAKDVYRSGPGPEGEVDQWWHDLELATFRAPDALVCGETAAAVYGLDGFDPGRVPIVLDVGRRGRAGPGRVRRTRLEPPETAENWRLTSLAETLVDLGDGLRPRPGCGAASKHLSAEELVELALEAALRRQLVDVDELRKLLAGTSPLRPGRDTLARVLDGRPPGTRPTGSYLETRMAQELRNAGLPAFERQVETFDEEGRIGFVDFRLGAVVLEGVGERWHLPKFDPDHARYARLGAGPFLFVPATFTHVEHETAAFVERVDRALRRDAARPPSVDQPGRDGVRPRRDLGVAAVAHLDQRRSDQLVG